MIRTVKEFETREFDGKTVARDMWGVLQYLNDKQFAQKLSLGVMHKSGR